MSKVTVVVPAHGRAWLLNRAIESIKHQNVGCEIIVVDDGSTPPLYSQLPEDVLSHIKLLTNDQNRNAAYSRNRGVEAASCEIVAFLDSDDEWHPNHLESGLRDLDFSKPVVHVTPIKANSEATVISDAYSYLFDNKGDFRSSGLICGKVTFDLIGGFDERLNKHQDWDFVLKASKFCRVRVGKEPTVRLDVTDKGRMSARPNLPASKLFFEKHHETLTLSQQATFFSGIVRACVLAEESDDQLDECRQWASRYIKPVDFDYVTRVCWKYPRFAHWTLRRRQWIRRFF